MPAYEYEITDPQTGEVLTTLTLVRPLLKRDQVKLRRKQVPGRVVVSGHAQNPHDPQHTVTRSYHRQEEKLGSRFRSRFTADQVKASFQVKPAPLRSEA